MENKFKKGLILGGLLAAGAVVGFTMTKPGQELTEELQKDLKTLAKRLKKSLHKLEDISKEKFDEAVSAVAEEYAKEKQLAIDVKDMLIVALQAKWYEMEAEYKAEKDEEVR